MATVTASVPDVVGVSVDPNVDTINEMPVVVMLEPCQLLQRSAKMTGHWNIVNVGAFTSRQPTHYTVYSCNKAASASDHAREHVCTLSCVGAGIDETQVSS